MLNQNWKLLPAALAIGLALAACDSGDDNDQGAPRPSTPAAPTPAAVSGPNNPTLLGLTDEGDLVQVKLGANGAPAVLRLTGAQPNSAPQALDFSPANGKLYVYYGDGRIYTANTATGALTLVGQTPFPSPGFIDAFDFNPVPNAIRALSDQGDGGNYRVSPADASLIATDTSAAYATGDSNVGKTPGIEGVAYTGANGATTTTAYVIDATQDVLARLGGASGAQPSPNSGQLFTVGALGTAIGGGGGVGFDIPTGQTTVGFVSDGSTGAQNADTDIYRIDLATGTLTKLQTVTGKRLVGLTIVPGTGTATTPPPSAPPVVSAPGLGLPADALCKRALAGTGYTVTPTVIDETNLCLLCSFDAPENLVDTDTANFSTASITGVPLERAITVSIKAPEGTTFTPAAGGEFVGGAFTRPGSIPGSLTLTPYFSIATFNDGTATEESAVFDSALIAGSLLGQGTSQTGVQSSPFFAGFQATKPFDEIQVVFDGTLGLNTSVNMLYGCTGAADAGGFSGFP